MKFIRTFRKIFFNLIWIVFTASVLFVASGIILSKKYEDKIISIAVEQINQQLDTKINVNEVEVSLFSKFPYISVVFKDVVIWSPENFNYEAFNADESEKLFEAEKIYLQFNLVHLLLKKYNIKRILAINGELNLFVDKEGRTNYNIFIKDKEESTDKKTRLIQLEAMRLSNFNLRFNNMAKSIVSESHIKDIVLKGKFSESEFSLASNSNLMLKSFLHKNISYAENYDLSIKTIFDVKDKIANISKGIISVNTINLKTSGTIDFSSQPNFNVQVEGRSLDINSLLNFIKGDFKEKFHFIAKGRADIATRITGILSPTHSPGINAVYLLTVSKLSHKKIILNNIQLKGRLATAQNGKGIPSLSIDKFRITDTNNKLEGNLYISDFSHPKLKFAISGYTELHFINDQLKGGSLKDLDGVIQSDIKMEASLESLKNFNIQRLIKENISGKLKLINAGFLAKEKYKITNLDGNVEFWKDRWQTDLSLNLNGSKSHIKATADYFLKYLFEDNQSLYLQADIQSEFLRMEEYFLDTSVSINAIIGIFLPENIYAKLNIDLGQFESKQLLIKDLKTIVNYKPGQLEVHDYNLNTMEGNIKGSGVIQQDPSGTFTLGSKNKLNSIAIKTLFESFGNFNQKLIKAENISGELSGDVEFSINADSMLKFSKESISLNSQIVINSGELIDFEPAKKLSVYIELEELEHIQFSTLTNTIFIREELITIPEMDIKSSAFNINISGTHSFDNYFDYKMKVNLSELLAGKAAKSKLENEEHFVVEENGRRTSLYLSVKGTPEDYQIKYDKKEAASNIIRNLKEEKNLLKNILNEEFGWFKKDSISSSTLIDENKNEFILDWGESVDSIDEKKYRWFRRNKRPVKEKEKFTIEWDDDDG
ncbi:MAG: hypothetical protein KAS71_08025 [Bacteroidales bacterium]|nr:hypothetical protein [Bacteroidales bacterium]